MRINLTLAAKELRRNSTDAERLLWRHLKAKQLDGLKFRRQEQIGRFIADFICYEKRLIIEADGGQHALEKEKDEERTNWLNSQGFTVLRFWNNEILTNITGVLETIRLKCSEWMRNDMTAKEITKLDVFEGRKTRKTIHNNEWWFSVADVVEALTESVDSRQYIKKMRNRDLELDSYWGTICTPLELLAPDGKRRKTNCSNTEGLFRIIQSIPSPKAEPFKRWLAKVGHERIQEIENPELAMARMQELYEKKGYPKEWIDKRMRGIAVRLDLTDEWKNRGARNSREYAILTNEIMQGAFDLKVDDYKAVKGLERENLRDHMTDMELILTMLAEATTTTLHRDRDTQGFEPLKKDARNGGAVAGRTRKDIEQQTGKPVVSQDNFKEISAPRRRKITQ